LTQSENSHNPRLITCASPNKNTALHPLWCLKKAGWERQEFSVPGVMGWARAPGRQCEVVENSQGWPLRQGRRIGPGSEAIVQGHWGAALSMGIKPAVIYCISLSDRPVMLRCQEERKEFQPYRHRKRKDVIIMHTGKEQAWQNKMYSGHVIS